MAETIFSTGSNVTINATLDVAHTISSEGSNINITTGDDNDTITSTGDNVTINAGAGSNSIAATGSNVNISSQNFADTVQFAGAHVTIAAADNSVSSNSPNITVDAANGKTTINSTGDNVTIAAGAGSNSIAATGSNVNISSQNFADTIQYAGARVTIAAANNSVSSNSPNITVDTANGKNTVTSTGSTINIRTGAGNDTISSTGDNVTISTGSGSDSVNSKGDRVNIAASGYVLSEGSRVTISATNPIENFVDSNGSNISIDATHSYSSVKSTGDNVTIIGGDSPITVDSSGTNLKINTGNGDNVISANGVGLNLVAGNGYNSVVVDSNYSTLTFGSGSNTLNLNNNIATVRVNGNNSANVIESLGNNSALALTGESNYSTLTTNGDNIKVTISGDYANNTLNAYGSNHTITVSGNGAYNFINLDADNSVVTITGGEGNFIENSSANSSITATPGEGYNTVHGVGNDTRIFIGRSYADFNTYKHTPTYLPNTIRSSDESEDEDNLYIVNGPDPDYNYLCLKDAGGVLLNLSQQTGVDRFVMYGKNVITSSNVLKKGSTVIANNATAVTLSASQVKNNKSSAVALNSNVKSLWIQNNGATSVYLDRCNSYILVDNSNVKITDDTYNTGSDTIYAFPQDSSDCDSLYVKFTQGKNLVKATSLYATISGSEYQNDNGENTIILSGRFSVINPGGSLTKGSTASITGYQCQHTISAYNNSYYAKGDSSKFTFLGNQSFSLPKNVTIAGSSNTLNAGNFTSPSIQTINQSGASFQIDGNSNVINDIANDFIDVTISGDTNTINTSLGQSTLRVSSGSNNLCTAKRSNDYSHSYQIAKDASNTTLNCAPASSFVADVSDNISLAGSNSLVSLSGSQRNFNLFNAGTNDTIAVEFIDNGSYKDGDTLHLVKVSGSDYFTFKLLDSSSPIFVKFYNSSKTF